MVNYKIYFPIRTKYIKWYINIIKNIYTLNRIKGKEYYELHHIIPKSIDNRIKNLNEHPYNGVLLTPREHYLCHLLLFKHFKKIKDKNNIQKMAYALNRMKSKGKYIGKINYKMTNETKKKISKAKKGNVIISEEHRNKISEVHKNKKVSKETKELISKGNKGKVRTEEQKLNHSIILKGHKKSEKSSINYSNAKLNTKHSEETKKKISEAKKGIVLSGETKKKISEAKKGKSTSTDYHKKRMKETHTNKNVSDETKEKISEAKKGKIMNKKTIKIFDNNDKLRKICHGDFKYFCKEIGISPYLFNQTSKDNGLFNTKKSLTQAADQGLIIYKGWYIEK